MNIIKTSNIIEPSQLQPFTGYSLEFLQNATKEMLYSIVQTFIGNVTSSTTPYILWGCVKTNTGGTNYSYTQGYIMFNKEIYYFPAIPTISITDTDVCTIISTPDSVADPLNFSNGVSFNVHDHWTLQLTNGISGSGSFNFNQCVSIQKPAKIRLKATNYTAQGNSGGNNPIPGITLTTPNDGVTRYYYINYKGVYENNTAPGTAVGMKFEIFNSTTSTVLDYSHIGFVTNGNNSMELAINLQDYTAVGPGETIIVRFEPNGTNGNASYNKLIMLEQ